MKPALFAVFAVMACFVGAIALAWEILILCAAIAPLLAGWTMRGRLKRLTGGVRPWLIHPLTLRYPLAVFDVWTIGGAILIGPF